jgi:hypothetical protein
MIYQRYEPVDPRDAFSVAASPDSEGTQDAAASQAAFLLSTRAAVLGVDDALFWFRVCTTALGVGTVSSLSWIVGATKRGQLTCPLAIRLRAPPSMTMRPQRLSKTGTRSW